MLCLSLTSDVVGVVEAVAVEFAGLGLFSRRTPLLLSRLAERVSTSLPGTVVTAWLRNRRKDPDLFMHTVRACAHMTSKQPLLLSVSPVKLNTVHEVSLTTFKRYVLSAAGLHATVDFSAFHERVMSAHGLQTTEQVKTHMKIWLNLTKTYSVAVCRDVAVGVDWKVNRLYLVCPCLLLIWRDFTTNRLIDKVTLSLPSSAQTDY